MSHIGSTRVKILNVEKAKEFHYLGTRKAVTGRLLPKSYLNCLVDRGSWKGRIFLTDLAYGLLSI